MSFQFEKNLIDSEGVEKDINQEIGERLLEAALLKGTKVNEGNHGVIFEINLTDCPDEFKDYIFGQAVDIPQEKLAAKILKIYFQGQGKHEAEMQQRAFEIINKEQNDDLAKIPEMLFYKELEIKTETLQDKLKNSGVKSSNQIEIIFMDYIKGEDLATYIYKKIFDNHPEVENSPRLLEHRKMLKEHPNFELLQDTVAELLKFQRPNEKQKVEGTPPRINKENKKKIFNFFRQKNIVLDGEIFKRIRRTMDILNQHNIYHNDLHERNIMLEFNEVGKIINVYLIDFDKASLGSVGDTDKNIVNEYQQLTMTYDERKQQQFTQLTSELERLEKGYQKSKNENWRNTRQFIVDALKKEEKEFFVALEVVINSRPVVGGEKFIGAIFLDLARNNKQKREKLLEFLDHYVEKPGTKTIQFWKDLINILENQEQHH